MVLDGVRWLSRRDGIRWLQVSRRDGILSRRPGCAQWAAGCGQQKKLTATVRKSTS